jgi:hypothetical protein
LPQSSISLLRIYSFLLLFLSLLWFPSFLLKLIHHTV